MTDQTTPELLLMYGFKPTDPSTGQGGDNYEKNGFIITQVEGTDEWVYGAGAAKRDVSTIDNLKAEWKGKMGSELTMEG